jgi:cell division protein FtsL
MEEKDDLRQRLIQRIDAKRVKINTFGRDLKRDGNRLTNLSIYCTAAAAIFTAGPALGGEKFATSVQQMLGLAGPSNVWQPLCLLAVILSAVATIANNLYKTREYATRLAKAESCSALLEGLQTSVEFGQLSLSEATKQY